MGGELLIKILFIVTINILNSISRKLNFPLSLPRDGDREMKICLENTRIRLITIIDFFSHEFVIFKKN